MKIRKTIVKMAPSLEDRISYLEAREEEHSKDLWKFKNKNVDLQAEICELKRENLQFEEKLHEMSKRHRETRDELQAVFSFKEEITKRLCYLESNLETLAGDQDRLGSLETVVNDARQKMQEMTRHCQSVLVRLDELERGRNEFGLLNPDTPEQTPPKQVADNSNAVNQEEREYRQSVRERLDGIDKQIEELKKDEDRLNDVETDICIVKEETTSTRKSMSDSLESFKTETEGIQHVVRALELRNDQYSKSIVYVKLLPSVKMEIGQRTRFDRVTKVLINGGDFDKESCCLQPQIKGDYVINVLFRQQKCGVVKMHTNQSNEESLYLGKTMSNDDQCSTKFVVSLEKGKAMWLEAERLEGDAYIDCCMFCSWRL